MPGKQVQSEMAYKSGMNYRGKPIDWKLTDRFDETLAARRDFAGYQGGRENGFKDTG